MNKTCTTYQRPLLLADRYVRHKSKLSPILACFDYSQPIANNRLGESKSTSLDTLWYIYSYIYRLVTKSKLIFSSNMIFFLGFFILFFLCLLLLQPISIPASSVQAQQQEQEPYYLSPCLILPPSTIGSSLLPHIIF